LARQSCAVDVATFTSRVLREYPPERLAEASRRYGYDLEHSPDDDWAWGGFRERGLMTLSELEKLSRWKSGGRQVRNIASNSDQAVRLVSRAAISVAKELPDEPGPAIGVLTTLHGVDMPTASTVMTAWKPDRFGILDIRAWNALRVAVPAAFVSVESPAGHRRSFRLAEADLYLRVIREIAKQVEMTCREVDKALWVLGGGT